MPRFFITEENFSDGRIVLSGDDANHISRSLRSKTGEKITVCDYFNYEYLCTIEKITADKVVLTIDQKRTSQSELSAKTKLFCAVLKGDKNELVIQKAVELGVNEIVFFQSENCVSRPDEKAAKNKLERWNKISLEAAKQCGRAFVPSVSGIIRFEEISKYMPQESLKLFCYEKESDVGLMSLLKRCEKEICFVTGPEGGFSPKEADIASKSGLVSVSLGNRILRAETAPLYVMSCIAFLFG